MSDVYCDFNQKEVDLYNSYDDSYTVDQCTAQCKKMDEENNYPEGTPMCCDYASYSDGSFQCILYTGQNVIDVNKADFPNDNFFAFTFEHGVYEAVIPPTPNDEGDNDDEPAPTQDDFDADGNPVDEEPAPAPEPDFSSKLALPFTILLSTVTMTLY